MDENLATKSLKANEETINKHMSVITNCPHWTQQFPNIWPWGYPSHTAMTAEELLCACQESSAPCRRTWAIFWNASSPACLDWPVPCMNGLCILGHIEHTHDWTQKAKTGSDRQAVFQGILLFLIFSPRKSSYAFEETKTYAFSRNRLEATSPQDPQLWSRAHCSYIAMFSILSYLPSGSRSRRFCILRNYFITNNP